jgi:signal transduction histidine kinase
MAKESSRQDPVQRLHKTNDRLKKKIEKMKQASQQKDSFISSMTHELRTPLNAIIGYSEMLQDEVAEAGNTEWGDDIQKIHTAGVHLLGVVNNLLDLSKIEAGKMTAFIEAFDINKVLHDVQDISSTLMEKNHNKFVIRAQENLGTMTSDLTKVRQSLLNFLSNSAKFTEKGVVTLACERKEEMGQKWVIFSISDTGIGMTPAQIKLLFRPFQQAENSTSKKFGGTGLGLTITKKFCEMLGGKVFVQSKFKQGTTFSIQLPAETKDIWGKG